ncbi:hypothetical protein EMPS_06818 [Entomortierella parvispora]|uniref:PIN domain-containing protein n=1 Tax=Entomortierella parvispora TaxID=205924 RepID=A0A9P3HD01_9FUNG|nr:hypothetical protein EMPS_06818 [Entomortierella parvispora]
MSTAKTGLIAPFIPTDNASASSKIKPNSGRKQRHQSKKLEKSPSFNNNLHNGLNNSTLLSQPAAASSSAVSAPASSGPSSNGRGNLTGAENGNAAGTVATGKGTSNSNNHTSSRNIAAPTTTPTVNNNRRKLFDPKHDPVPVVPSATSQSRPASGSGPGNARNKDARSQRQPQSSGRGPPQQHQQLWQPQSSTAGSTTNSAPARTNAPTTVASSSPASPRADSALVRLTKEIQQLEKKVMEKPGRRSLDSDEEDTESRYGQGHLFWNRRTENAKKLASKYLKLLELDFKSSMKHDIDTRCWKLAIYPLIETFRAALRNAEHTNGGMSSSGSMSLSESDEDHTSTIRHCFSEFISFAQEFYIMLQSTLQTLEGNASNFNGRSMPPRWHRCIGIMGDLARYRWLHKLDEFSPASTDWLIVARKFYREAIDLGPGNGKMYNQLALLSGSQDLEALYYYSKSLTVKSSFMNARDTLMSFFATNEHIQTLSGLSLKPSSKNRQASLIANASLMDCEGSFLLLHAMLFEKINLDKFEKRLRNFSKQIRSLLQRQQHRPQTSNHSPRPQQEKTFAQDQGLEPTSLVERWDGFYFMQAVINIAALYEFNWAGSVVAKASTRTGPVIDLLDSVATLPYSSKLLLSTMEQTMRNYMRSTEDNQKKLAQSAAVAEQQLGWLVYCHVVLVWMASKPFGTSSGSDMLESWLLMADQESLPNFWTTMTEFMNLHWNQLSPFEQSDMLSALSEEISDQIASESGPESSGSHLPKQGTSNTFRFSTPPLGHEWELRGLAWIPMDRFGPQMFKGSQPVLGDDEVKDDCLWTHDSIKIEQLSKRIVELSLVAAMNMSVIEFDFCENAFKVNEDYAAQVQESLADKSHLPPTLGVALDDYSTDEKSFGFSQEECSGLEEEDETALFSSDGLDYGDHMSTSEILELKSKRDQLKSLLSESNANGRMTVSLGSLQREYKPRPAAFSSGASNGNGRRSHQRAYTDRRHGGDISHRAPVPENSILVIDTNCLVADWTLIQRLVNADRWTVVVPLAVITELDGLKNNPPPLGPSAASALTYLETCLAMRPKPRRLKIQTSRGNYMNDLSFRVESFNYEKQRQHQQHRRKTSSGGDGEETDDMYQDEDEEIMRNHNVDDFILGLCLWHQDKKSAATAPSSSSSPSLQSTTQGGVYLVTDDRNLRVKARARNMDVLGKDDIGRMTARQQRQ